MPASDLHVVTVDRTDPRLGRQVVHDPRSRSFPMRAADTSTWRSRTIRLYDPTPNPNQTIGDCTGCDKAMDGNAAGNRLLRRVLDYDTPCGSTPWRPSLDPWDGEYPPTDTGSSGLAACKAAQQLGLGGAYQWALAGGVNAVVQQIMDGNTVGVGTWWYEGGFNPKPRARGRRVRGDDRREGRRAPVADPRVPRTHRHAPRAVLVGAVPGLLDQPHPARGTTRRRRRRPHPDMVP
jgi:hypothetical protein